MNIRMNRRSVLKGLGAGAALAATGLPRAARAATTLVFSSWLPPTHPIVANAYVPWARDVEAATDGRVRVRMLSKALGPAPAHFDMAREGVADITFGLHSFTPGDRFLLSRLAEFSFLGDDAVELSAAYWHQFRTRLAATGMHDGVHTLAVYTHGPGALHNRVRPLLQPGDVEGLKLRVPGGHASELVKRMGGIPLLTSSTEVYEMLANGIADGVTFTLEALTAFKLIDHLKYTTTVPGGIYNTSWFFVMNQAKWDALGDADREAISALSGEAFARRVGAAWVEADRVAMERIRAAGIEVAAASEPLVAALAKENAALEAGWAEAAAAHGVDGAAALRELRAATGIVLPPA